MEKEKITQILIRCQEVFNECSVTIKWLATYVKEHPNIIDIPESISLKITNTQLDLYDVKILLENTLKSLGKDKEES